MICLVAVGDIHAIVQVILVTVAVHVRVGVTHITYIVIIDIGLDQTTKDKND